MESPREEGTVPNHRSMSVMAGALEEAEQRGQGRERVEKKCLDLSFFQFPDLSVTPWLNPISSQRSRQPWWCSQRLHRQGTEQGTAGQRRGVVYGEWEGCGITITATEFPQCLCPCPQHQTEYLIKIWGVWLFGFINEFLENLFKGWENPIVFQTTSLVHSLIHPFINMHWFRLCSCCTLRWAVRTEVRQAPLLPMAQGWNTPVVCHESLSADLRGATEGSQWARAGSSWGRPYHGVQKQPRWGGWDADVARTLEISAPLMLWDQPPFADVVAILYLRDRCFQKWMSRVLEEAAEARAMPWKTLCRWHRKHPQEITQKDMQHSIANDWIWAATGYVTYTKQ